MDRGTAGGVDGDRQLLWVGGIAVVLLLGFGLLMVTGDEEAGAPVTSLPDVHGIAVDPEDSDVLYVATHDGLMRAVEDEGFRRVGSSTDDLMGFSVHPENGSIFWVSGHTSWGNMGVRQSTDAGQFWTTLGLEGVDFHAMAVSPADPDRLWGEYRGDVYRSDDGGHEWEVVSSSPQRVFNLEPHPADADVVFAAGQQGIHRSSDGGSSWELWRSNAATDLAIHPADPGLRVLSTGGGVYRSVDGGENWGSMGLDVGSETIGYLAFDPQDRDTLYAASFETGIYKTSDGGETWSTVLAAR